MPFPVDVQFITAAEQKLGVRFPPAYVTKMVRANGGEIQSQVDVWFLYPFLDTSDRTRLKRTCNDVVRETKNARARPGFPPDAVAIGENGGGDLLLFVPQPDAPELLSSVVYWWDHETDELNHIADDFSHL